MIRIEAERKKVGRPALVTRERLVDKGIEITLPKLTMKGMAAALGVSEMSVFRNVGNLENLYLTVAEGMCERMELPDPTEFATPREYLHRLSEDLLAQNVRYPGIAAYLSHLTPQSVSAFELMDRVSSAYAEHFGWELGVASAAVNTIAGTVVALSAQFAPEASTRLTVMQVDEEHFPALVAGAEFLKGREEYQVSSFSLTIEALMDGVFSRLGYSPEGLAL